MKQAGFSIVEVLIALAIIAAVTLGVFALLGPALKASSYGANSLIAVMLAKENLELTGNIRDTNWFIDTIDNGILDGSTPWNQGLEGVGGFRSMTGVIDNFDSGITYANNSYFDSCPTSGASDAEKENQLFVCDQTKLYLDANNFYTRNPSGAVETPYRRVIEVENDGTRLKITSIVRWGDYSSASKEVRLVSYLYNWMSD